MSCIQGDIITPGYWNNSVATRDKIKDGWLHTGDLVCSDSEGYLYLKRKDDMYISVEKISIRKRLSFA
jgi:fatty-acyl-CoA synthase